MFDSTLVLILKGQPASEILLGFKKVGFGLGKYTGFGGKVETGETILQAAVRELVEETGIVISRRSLVKVAALSFHFPYKPAWNQRVHVFITRQNEIVASETQEMAPHWFKISELPYEQMWDDARYWLPRILNGECIRADFSFQPDNATVARAEFRPCRFESNRTQTIDQMEPTPSKIPSKRDEPPPR